MLDAMEAHRAWIREVGGVLRDARAADAADLPARARAAAASGRAVFGPARALLAGLDTAPQAAVCQEIAAAWIAKHLAACDQLDEAARTGHAGDLRAVHGILADARHDLAAFSARFAALVAGLRAHVEAAPRARRART